MREWDIALFVPAPGKGRAIRRPDGGFILACLAHTVNQPKKPESSRFFLMPYISGMCFSARFWKAAG
jgi:hypothetical protein